MMGGLRECSLLDLRRDRSRREQEEELGGGRNSRRESLAGSLERKQGEV